MSDPNKSKEVLKELQAAFKPVFDEQRRIWEENRDRVETLLADAGITVSNAGGNCPVQVEGMVDAKPFYFRARGNEWEMRIGPREAWFTPDCWVYEEDYGEWPEAGWMPLHEAYEFIAKAVAIYRAQVAA